MSIRSISSTFNVSRNTVRRYVRTIQDLNISNEQLLTFSEEHLRDIFSEPNERKREPSATEVEFDELAHDYVRRLSKRGVTKEMLFQEYRKEHPDGYKRSAFNSHLRRYVGEDKFVGHFEHNVADQMYVDFAGDKLEIVDEQTGLLQKVEVFVAILPYSHYTFCEAVRSQSTEDFIKACEDAFWFYGGVTAAIVPDNLKAAVVKAAKVEPVINSDFEAFADYYGCAVFPARVRHPKDKALVENAVKLMYRSVYQEIEGSDYHSLDDLNAAIRKALSNFNDKKMSKRSHSRSDLFESVEKVCLRPLPKSRFPMRERRTLTVHRDGCVTLNKHHYSVPEKYIGYRMEVAYDADTVYIYYDFSLVTTHQRDDTPYTYSRKGVHGRSGMSHNDEQSLNEIYARAADIDNILLSYLKAVAAERKYLPQAFKSCRAIMKLEGKYGQERLVHACGMALDAHALSFTELSEILKAGRDLQDADDEASSSYTTPLHKNVRGKDYYSLKTNENEKK